MKGIERTIVIIAMTNMAIYMPCFFFLAIRMTPGFPSGMIIWHFAGMILNLIALVITIRDLYLRHFPNANSKVTWCLLITWTGGIGWIVYVFKHALKPRPEPVREIET